MQDSKALPQTIAQDESAARPLPTFEELSKQRKLLQEFCFAHIPTVGSFLAADYEAFPIFLDDGESEPTKFRHITSSATCYSSIAACPGKFRPEKKDGAPNLELLGQEFAEKAIELPLKRWRSDDAAEIYCSCRGLPFVVSTLEKWHPNIDLHLGRIFYQLQQAGRFAIGEAAQDKEKSKIEEQESWYKPNAYHTYWTLELLRILSLPRFQAGAQKSEHFKAATATRYQMQSWARQQLGFQVGLHSAGSSVLDSDQLAWALAILISQTEEYRSNLAEQDFIRQAFRCLFSTQESVGTWRHYGPLFHYPHAGNAYCYVFETFAAILKEALQPDAAFVRATLRQYFGPLIKLWEYAASTRTKSAKGKLAWSSGHRISPRLESWATASVFEFAQALRRLVGIWTREEALSGLNHKSQLGTQQEAKATVLERAAIWSCPDLKDRLWSMFINPVCTANPEHELDPDQPLVDKMFPRAAILFGPPGTSKTALVGAIAGSIGWKYIELHPSHFVAEGLPKVQHTADLIFRKLMELDRAVVLFDEIDELVRERDIEPDQFGRFLTTSMLPRLAELWKARKIMYFVATNHIEYFDRAVTRSERFDAIIFISPPSFEAKRKETIRILHQDHGVSASFADQITQELIEKAMPVASCESADKAAQKEDRDRMKSEPLPQEQVLAKFALLRWDELNELALYLRDELTVAKVITAEMLKTALLRIKDVKSRGLGEYCRFLSDPRYYERFDASRKAVWVVTGFPAGAKVPSSVETLNGLKIVKATVGPIANVEVPGFKVGPGNEKGEAGRIKLQKL